MSSFTMFKLGYQNLTGQNLIKVEGEKEIFMTYSPIALASITGVI